MSFAGAFSDANNMLWMLTRWTHMSDMINLVTVSLGNILSLLLGSLK